MENAIRSLTKTSEVTPVSLHLIPTWGWVCNLEKFHGSVCTAQTSGFHDSNTFSPNVHSETLHQTHTHTPKPFHGVPLVTAGHRSCLGDVQLHHASTLLSPHHCRIFKWPRPYQEMNCFPFSISLLNLHHPSPWSIQKKETPLVSLVWISGI